MFGPLKEARPKNEVQNMNSIRKKITVSLIATVLIALAAVGASSIFLNYRSTLVTVEQMMGETAILAAERIEQELTAYKNVAMDTGFIAQLSSGSTTVEEKQAIIDERVNTHGFQRGNLISAGGYSLFDGKDYSDREYVQQALKGNVYVSEPLVSKITGELSIMVAAPVYAHGSRDSQIAGVVYFVPPETFLNDIVSSIRISEGCRAYMINKSGDTIADVTLDTITTQNVERDAQSDRSLKELAAIHAEMRQGKNGFGSFQDADGPRYAAYAPVGGTDGWSVAVTAMKKDYLTDTYASMLLNVLVMLFCDPILRLLQVPAELLEMMHTYVWIIFMGLIFVFFYNYFTYLLRAVGNSVVPLYFLGATALLNVVLDIVFVVACKWGIAGAAAATVIAQALSGMGLMAYTWMKEPNLRFDLRRFSFSKDTAVEILRFAFSSSIQQSVMNFGILMIQGLVNSFGAQVMAAFAAAVKIDSFAYMPAQEFGNAFSLFISQNHGAGENARVRQGMKSAVRVSMAFCVAISLLVFVLAPYLMLLFIDPAKTAIIAIGAGYLRVEGAFYCGIGVLFLLYGYYRGINRPEMSLVLTIISLGTRVILAYVLAPIPQIGVTGIWSAIPIGWVLADITGILYLKHLEKSR